MQLGEPLHHLTYKLPDLVGVEHSERVGQHEALYSRVLECVDEVVDILRGVFHPVAPVLEVEVDADAFRGSIVHTPLDVVHMLLECLLELEGEMLEGPLAEEVHRRASAVVNPVDGCLSVNKAQHLNTLQLPALPCPAADGGDGLLLSFGDTSRCDFNAVDIDVSQEHPGDAQLLMRHERHSVCLLSVAQRRVHDFDIIIQHEFKRIVSNAILKCYQRLCS